LKGPKRLLGARGYWPLEGRYVISEDEEEEVGKRKRGGQEEKVNNRARGSD